MVMNVERVFNRKYKRFMPKDDLEDNSDEEFEVSKERQRERQQTTPTKISHSGPRPSRAASSRAKESMSAMAQGYSVSPVNNIVW